MSAAPVGEIFVLVHFDFCDLENAIQLGNGLGIFSCSWGQRAATR